MCKKGMFLMCVVLTVLMGSVPVLAATCNFYNTSGDHLWGTAANWSTGTVPTGSDYFTHRFPVWGGENTDILITSGYDAECLQAIVGQDKATDGVCVLNVEGSLNVSGGDLFTVGYLATGAGEVNVNGGSISITTNDKNAIGLHGEGLLHITDGTVTLTQRGLWLGYGPTGVGHIQMDGGLLDAAAYLQWRNGAGTIDLAGGTIMIDGDKQNYMNNHMDFITAYGGAGTVVMEYDGTHTYLSGIPEPATIALLGLGGMALIRRRRA